MKIKRAIDNIYRLFVNIEDKNYLCRRHLAHFPMLITIQTILESPEHSKSFFALFPYPPRCSFFPGLPSSHPLADHVFAC